MKQYCSVSNKIIIATIHQPSIEVFYLFDQLILLSNGRCCFNANIEEVHEYFAEQLRARANPADIIVFEAQKHSQKFVGKWADSEKNQYAKQRDWSDYKSLSMEMVQNGQVDVRSNIDKAPVLVQYQLLLKREVQRLWRDARVTIIRLIQVICFAMVSGFIFYEIKDSFGKKQTCFVFISMIPLIFGIVSLLTAFPQQKLLFIREHNSRAYNASVWALCLMLIEIPKEMVYMLLFTLIAYSLIGLDGDFGKYVFIFFLSSFAGGSFGILFGSISKTAIEAAQLVPAALIPLLMFADGIVELQALPEAVQWIAGIDPLYYLVRCLYVVEFEGAVYEVDLQFEEGRVCRSYEQIVEGVLDDCLDQFDSSATCSTISTPSDYNVNVFEVFCGDTYSGKDFFAQFALEPEQLTSMFIYVLIICVVLRILSVLLLLFMDNNGFSWMKKKIIHIFSTQNEKKRALKDHVLVQVNNADTKLPQIVEVEVDVEVDLDLQIKTMESTVL